MVLLQVRYLTANGFYVVLDNQFNADPSAKDDDRAVAAVVAAGADVTSSLTSTPGTRSWWTS